jgi:hypothetical protein
MTWGPGRQHKSATPRQMAMGVAWGCLSKPSLLFQVGTGVLAW